MHPFGIRNGRFSGRIRIFPILGDLGMNSSLREDIARGNIRLGPHHFIVSASIRARELPTGERGQGVLEDPASNMCRSFSVS